MGICKHVDPELVHCEPLRELLCWREDSESHRELGRKLMKWIISDVVVGVASPGEGTNT